MDIAIVTDSTSDIPVELARQHNITVVPLNVHFGNESFKDGVTISPDEFYAEMRRSKELPKTSQPSPGEFVETYEQLAKDFSHIVSVHISHKMSGTLASARQAKELLGDKVKVEVIDSEQASMALGFTAIAGASAARGGASFTETIDVMRDTAQRSRFMGVVQSLENLRKGGRIGRAQGLLGSLLHIKPMLEVLDGEAAPAGRPRTLQRGMEMMYDAVAASAPLNYACALYTVDKAPIEPLLQRLSILTRPTTNNDSKTSGSASQPGANPVAVARIGSVVGTYLAEGAVGVAVVGSQRRSQ